MGADCVLFGKQSIDYSVATNRGVLDVDVQVHVAQRVHDAIGAECRQRRVDLFLGAGNSADAFVGTAHVLGHHFARVPRRIDGDDVHVDRLGGWPMPEEVPEGTDR